MVKTLTAPNRYSVFSFSFSKMVGSSKTWFAARQRSFIPHFAASIDVLTHQPLPIDQPTTPQALPRALTSRGKISAG